MRMIPMPVRKDWRAKVESQGLNFHTHDNGTYWCEDHCYEFDRHEIAKIEKAAGDLHQMCLDAVDFVISKDRFSQLAIPENRIPAIKKSWQREDPSAYGRFDFSYQNGQHLKLLEYNADTPTSLLETAIIQYYWLQDQKIFLGDNTDQFNFLHESLVDFWKWYVKNQVKDENEAIYFSGLSEIEEDEQTVEFMRDCCAHSGHKTENIYLHEIGWNGSQFLDLNEKPIKHLFKLHPWEIAMTEEFGAHLLSAEIRLIEPPWKMILSNKGILPILWEMYPDHPHLLPAYFEAGKIQGPYIRKPIFSREGANVFIFTGQENVESGGIYGAEGYIYQQFAPLPNFSKGHAMLGVWIVGEIPCGMGIRESSGLITDNQSRYVPHIIR